MTAHELTADILASSTEGLCTKAKIEMRKNCGKKNNRQQARIKKESKIKEKQ